MTYTFICNQVSYISSNQAHIKKVHYFNDRCAGYNKNHFNFSNVYKHFGDFSIECEWYFFATSNSKSACDGVVKRITSKASLQTSYQDQILTLEEMFRYCKDALSDKITLFFNIPEKIREK